MDYFRCELKLPGAENRENSDKLRWWISRRSGLYTEFESLVGHLAHAATLIHQGLTFLQRAYVI